MLAWKSPFFKATFHVHFILRIWCINEECVRLAEMEAFDWLKLMKPPPQNKCLAGSTVWNFYMQSLWSDPEDCFPKFVFCTADIWHSVMPQHIMPAWISISAATLTSSWRQGMKLIAGQTEQGCPASIPSQHYWSMIKERTGRGSELIKTNFSWTH